MQELRQLNLSLERTLFLLAPATCSLCLCVTVIEEYLCLLPVAQRELRVKPVSACDCFSALQCDSTVFSTLGWKSG